MNIIVAVDENWGIGRRGDILVRIPNDQKHFREETAGKTVVYGRKTLATFPQGLPLPGRTNIVMSSDPDFKVKGAVTVHSLKELFRELKQYRQEDVYIIGGESIYRQMLPYCDTAHVTKIEYEYEADSFFPDLDQEAGWEITADSDEQVYFDITYYFLKYEKKKGASTL